MTCSRWIAVCVDTLDHAILDKGAYDRRSAWVWMIANACWHDRRINHKGKPLEMKRGQLLAGRAFLASKWGWTEKQVRIFIDQLASEDMIKKGQSDGHFANVVTICNYDVYQTSKDRQQPAEGPEQGQSRASEGPEQGQTLTSTTITTLKKDDMREDGPVSLFEGQIVLSAKKTAFWMPSFGNDAQSLALALIQAAGYTQPNDTSYSLEVKVDRQLARLARDKRDQDQRYAKAAEANAAKRKPDAAARTTQPNLESKFPVFAALERRIANGAA